MTKPYLSIVIPTFNRSQTLARCLDSIVVQTFNQWEAIVVDDASTDSTPNVIKPYLSQKRITYLRHPHNLGFYAARNSGIQRAVGEWISFLDSDDEYLPQALATIREAAKTYSTYEVLKFMLISDKEHDGHHELGYLPPHKNWHTYAPTYDEIVCKSHIVADMHRVVKADVAKKYAFNPQNPGFETAHYADMAKAGIHFLYINRTVALIHELDEDRLSLHKHRRWPRKFSIIYATFLHHHYKVLRKHKLLSTYVWLIATCLFYQVIAVRFSPNLYRLRKFFFRR